MIPNRAQSSSRAGSFVRDTLVGEALRHSTTNGAVAGEFHGLRAPLQTWVGEVRVSSQAAFASDQETRDRAERGSVVRGSARASVVAPQAPSPD